MSDEDYILDPMPDLGVQGDGEPAVVNEGAPEPVKEAQEANEQEGEQPKEGEEQHEPPKKKPGSARARERLARVEAENQQLRQMLLAQQPKAEPEKPRVDEGEPDPAQFTDHDAYMTAKIQHEARKIVAEKEAKEAATKQKEAIDGLVAKGREKYEDFDLDFQEVLQAPLLSQTVAEALTDSAVAPDLVHHFAENPDDLRRISLLSPVRAARELVALEATFATPKQPEPKQVQKSNAPKPVTPASTQVNAKPSEDGRHLLY